MKNRSKSQNPFPFLYLIVNLSIFKTKRFLWRYKVNSSWHAIIIFFIRRLLIVIITLLRHQPGIILTGCASASLGALKCNLFRRKHAWRNSRSGRRTGGSPVPCMCVCARSLVYRRVSHKATLINIGLEECLLLWPTFFRAGRLEVIVGDLDEEREGERLKKKGM